ncbi:hypothetical protein CALCODRAFT_520828 [Calocera cornea HHB12733]|uniref:Peptidase C14 caspase domain-containing protein n=1 Tax=Calocera cornea HHB12733 TaxID=1353952 RepID=A0A165D7X5_9BASI|nr:hypothetical protein CALCODRAFT_520828 [Calocera cornea HHB12733]
MATPFSLYDESTPPHLRRAYLIGISYKNHSNRLARLKEPHHDVQRMKEWLIEEGCPEENIMVATDEKGIESTTYTAIMNGIEALIAPAIADPTQPYSLLFYYAGHGTLELDPTGREKYNQDTDGHPLDQITTIGSLTNADVTRNGNMLHALTPSITVVTSDNSSLESQESSTHRPPPLTFVENCISASVTVPATPANATTLQLLEPGPSPSVPRPASAPPEPGSRVRERPLIEADVICIGAGRDDDLSADWHSLARVVPVICRSTNNRGTLTYARLLSHLDWEMSELDQVPQLSSSRDLAGHWDTIYRL